MGVVAELNFDSSEVLFRLFDEMDKKVAKKTLRSAIKAVVRGILEHIRSIAPVLQYDKEGRIRGALKRGLKMRAVRGLRNKFGYQIITPTRDEIGIPQNDKWYYPSHVEYELNGKDSYLRRGWDDRESAAVLELERRLGNELEKLWRSN